MMPGLRFLNLYPDALADDMMIKQELSPSIHGNGHLPCPDLEEVVIGSQEVTVESLEFLLVGRASRFSPLRRLSTPRWEELSRMIEVEKIGGTKITSCDGEGQWAHCEDIRVHYLEIITVFEKFRASVAEHETQANNANNAGNANDADNANEA